MAMIPGCSPGGQSLVPLMNMRMARPRVLVDLNRCAELAYVRAENGHVSIGAMTLQAVAERSPVVSDHVPLLAQCLPLVGPPATRNRGTIGGTLAHADPAAELPGVALALDADLIVEGSEGRRTITAEAFFIAELTTSIRPGEMLREVRFARHEGSRASAFIESGNRQEGMALAGVACSLDVDQSGVCRSASLAAIGVGPRPMRLSSVEHALAGQVPTKATIDEIAELAASDIDPSSDVHASAHYRRRLAVALVAKAVRQAAISEDMR